MKHVWDTFEDKIKNNRERRKAEIDYAHKHIRRIGMNLTLARAAGMRTILRDDGCTGIVSTNSLESSDVITKAALGQGLAYIKLRSS